MKPKNPDRLIRINILVTEYQKEHLEKLGKQQASVYIRKLINAQMSGHEVEISKLEEENRQHEAHININKAQINQLKETDQRKQAAGQTREELIEEITQRLSDRKILDFSARDFLRVFNNNLEDANQVLNGNGEPITPEELKERTIQKANARKRSVYV